LLRIKGELLLLQGVSGAASAAEDHYQQALGWARRQGALSWELRAATSLARLLRDQNRSTEAIALLAPIYDRFTEGFETVDLKAARALIDGLCNTDETSRSPLMDVPPKPLDPGTTLHAPSVVLRGATSRLPRSGGSGGDVRQRRAIAAPEG
jgi:hypothetical protein